MMLKKRFHETWKLLTLNTVISHDYKELIWVAKLTLLSMQRFLCQSTAQTGLVLHG